jgi:glycosyltransferase involved in cell wall biosynthesis
VKLLVLDQFSELGGAQHCLMQLLPAMRARGWDALVGLPGDGPLVARIRECGFETVTLDCGPYSYGRKTLADMARFLTQTPRLARQIAVTADRFGPDLLYVNGPRLLPAVERTGLPVVHHAHRILPSRAVRELCGRAVKHCEAHVIAVCRSVAEPWLNFAGADRVTVIYNGIAGHGAPIRAATVRERSVVGCIGRIMPEKGQLEFVKVAALIHKQAPECRFEIHGAAVLAHPRYERTVRAAAESLPIEFAGWTADVPGALAGLDLLLAPSDGNEATPVVIMQAFAAGTPVIAFAAGGIPEIIEDGRTGVLVNSVAEMASRSLELLRDAGRRAEIAAAAYESWRRRFSLERWQNSVLDYIERHQRTPEAITRGSAIA